MPISSYNRQHKTQEQRFQEAVELIKTYGCLPIDFWATRELIEHFIINYHLKTDNPHDNET